jgi:hypothetical protein
MQQGIIVTTGDIKQDYEIIGPVYFQISNKPEGFASSTYMEYKAVYEQELANLKRSGEFQGTRSGNTEWGYVWGEYCLGESAFEFAFYISVEELKKRAAMLGGDAVVFMRQDIDLDTEVLQYFYLQMYGTAVKLK